MAKQLAAEPILEVNELVKKFPVYGPFGRLVGPKAHVNAVREATFRMYEGETYGLVGESGSGKSTTGRAILGLTPATSGEVLYRARISSSCRNRNCAAFARTFSSCSRTRSLP